MAPHGLSEWHAQLKTELSMILAQFSFELSKRHAQLRIELSKVLAQLARATQPVRCQPLNPKDLPTNSFGNPVWTCFFVDGGGCLEAEVCTLCTT